MIIGEYTSKITDNKRVAIPKKFRKELGENLILTRGYEKALILVNKDMWSKVAGDVVGGSFINKDIRDTSRFLVGSAIESTPDTQGRIVVPQSLFEYGEFKEEVVFLGLVNWIEVWSKSLWQERLKYLSENSDEIANHLSLLSQNK
jgi:MraZ protein